VSRDKGISWEQLLACHGTVTTIALSPKNLDTLYVGTVSTQGGGVYKSTDGGHNWIKLEEGLGNVPIIDLKIHPNDPQLLFVATSGEGLFKAPQGGDIGWSNISGDLPEGQVWSLALHPYHIDTLYAGTPNGLFKTTNGGQTWRDITGNNFQSRAVPVVACASAEPEILFAGTLSGLYKSTDGGKSWEEKSEGLTHRAIYSLLILNSHHILLGTADGFYESLDGGNSWQKKIKGLMALNNVVLAFDVTGSLSRVFVGTRESGIFYSEDGGESWQHVNASDHWDIKALALNPENPQIIWAGGPQGLRRSEDGGRSWRKAEAPMGDRDILAIAINPHDPQIIYVGTSRDGLYKTTDGGQTWINMGEGIEGQAISHIALDPIDPRVVYVASQGLYKSIDEGESWQYIAEGLYEGGRVLTPSDLAINPLNPNTLFAATSNGIYKSTDGGLKWEPVSTYDVPSIYRLTSVTIDPSDTNTIYAAGSKIYVSKDGGKNWDEMMEGLSDWYGFVYQIRVDPSDPRRIYAATNGYGVLVYYRKSTGLKPKAWAESPTIPFLLTSYPNPFNAGTTIQYQIPLEAKVTLKVYNLTGQEIRTLLKEVRSPAGAFKVQWDGRDNGGRDAGSGVYICRLTAGHFSQSCKMIKLR